MKRFAFFLFLLSSFASAETLNLTAGTMTSGGMLGAKFHADDLKNFGGGAWSGGANFDFGVFVIDNLALTFDVSAEGKLTTAADTSRKFSLGANVMYAFDTDSMVRPYITLGASGANWTPTTAIPQTSSAWGVGAKLQLGVLVGLNEYVALDFGVQGKALVPLSASTGGTTAAPATTPLTISFDGAAGYFGVRGFF